jgi:pimeloyl-ACP methyl ester carboxylesterase
VLDDLVSDGRSGVDLTIRTGDGRQVGACDLGGDGRDAVLWSHGGPGSRLEPAWLQGDAIDAGLRIIGVDRPGYGLSSPRPGRTIADGVHDLLAVADHLGLDRFLTVGVSTGGAYALAAAAIAPSRVRGVVACCAVTDMAHGPARATMHGPQVQAVWNAPDRDAAMAAAEAAYGQLFSKLLDGGMTTVLAPSDAETFADPAWMGPAMAGFGEMSAHGLAGYVDDRIADGMGWSSFDIADIDCPGTVLHGDHDLLCDVVHARHTARIVPGAALVIVPGAGHFSIERHIVAGLTRLIEVAPG